MCPDLLKGETQKRWLQSRLVVTKVGGSVLLDVRAFHRAAAFLWRRLRESPGEKLLAVVSAESGFTDSLHCLAKQFVFKPDPAALDLLWSTGELRSVALLAMCLQARGVGGAGLNIHETGLVLPEGKDSFSDVELDSRCLLDALASHPVVIVPGFLARRPSGAIVSLGRGGSDLTAVLLAAKLQAHRCELIKDVPGYFDKDPNRHADAQHLPVLAFETALAMADAGCDLVQRQAIEVAAAHRLPLVIRSLKERAPFSWVGPQHNAATWDKYAQELGDVSSHPETTASKEETTK